MTMEKDSVQGALHQELKACQEKIETETYLRKKAENALLQANKELESLSYSMSHDLRAPLRAIDGFSHILSDKFANQLDPEALRLLNIVRDSTKEMEKLINALLSFSRVSRQALEKKNIEVYPLVQETVELLSQDLQGRKVDITINPLPANEADPGLIRQVFMNLISNAMKFTKNNLNSKIEIGSFVKEGHIVYYVKDNGAGFDMKYMDKLFGVFQRLHSSEEYEGVGIGLAICRRIVQQHGGTLWVEAAVNEGATFYLTLDS